MRTEITFNPAYATLTAHLQPGESIKAEPGAMVAQVNVELSTSAPGGILKGLRRMLGRESFFINTFTAANSPSQVILAPISPASSDADTPASLPTPPPSVPRQTSAPPP